MRIGSAHLWVHDQEVALKFWTDKVGMEVREDVSFPEEMGNFRWLTVGPPGQDDVNLVLMAVPGEPVMDDATRKQVLELTAKGFAGTVFLVTDDIDKSYRGDDRHAASNSTSRRTRCRTASTRVSATRRETACVSPNSRRAGPILRRCEPPPPRSGQRPSSWSRPERSSGWAPG